MHHIADEEWTNPAALDRLTQAEAAATPAKWVSSVCATTVHIETVHHIEGEIATLSQRGNGIENARFVAMLRNAARDLIAAARRDLWQREQVTWLWNRLQPHRSADAHVQTTVQHANATIRMLAADVLEYGSHRESCRVTTCSCGLADAEARCRELLRSPACSP